MTEFTGKEIIRAVYTNEAHDTVMVEFYNGQVNADGSRVIIPMYISSDPNSTNLKALFAEGYDFERIQKETVIHNAEQAMAYRKLVKAEAAFEINKVKAEYQKKYEEMLGNSVAADKTSVLSLLLEFNEDEEALFRTKLAIFELPQLKAVTDKEVKQKIRTSKTLLELFGILNSIING